MYSYKAPTYTKEMLFKLTEDEVHYPYTDEKATYVGEDHQYELTVGYFTDRGRNLETELEGNDPERVKHFLAYLRRKVYLYVYTHSRSTRSQLNYLIAKRALRGYSREEYRNAFLDAMFIEGCYLLDNGDISSITGVDFDMMQNMSADVMRNQDRDMHKNCIQALQELGLNYYGKYSFVPQGEDW